MALNDLELSLMAFPQRWNGLADQLTLNILLLPVGDPTVRFAGNSIPLRINFAAGLETLPTLATVPTRSIAFTAQPPPVAPAIFTQLRNELVAKGISVTSAKLAVPPPTTARVLKQLPGSYRQAFAFEKPRSDDLRVGDGFGCALRAQAPGLNPVLPRPDDKISWGQIISYVLRQPRLAQAAGLIHAAIPLRLTAEEASEGGFLWVSLDSAKATDPWVAAFTANHDVVKSYAARIPELSAPEERPLFAATLLPIVAVAPGNLGEPQREAGEYDDGFAQIVHSFQPVNIDTATLSPQQIAPGAESGIHLGWDDEQVTVWLNHSIDLLRDRVTAIPNRPESPVGVQGYRIDVRQSDADPWRSLCIIKGTLPFDQNGFGSGAITPLDGDELWVSPAPIRPGTNDNSTNTEPAWLPLYFGQWTGSSMVLPDPIVNMLAYAVKVAGTPQAADPIPLPPLPNPSPNLTLVPALRYGENYQFRVRMVDLTGGGPLSGDDFIHPGTAPVAHLGFRRHLPPKALEIVSTPPDAPPPARPLSVRTIQTLEVRRPRIGYPEALFAGVDPNTFSQANLAALIQDALATTTSVSVPDPDCDRFEVVVEARVPAHDSGPLDDDFRVIYSVEIPFPADVESDPAVIVSFDYTDGIDDIAILPAPAPGTVTLPVPTARDIRVRAWAKAADRVNYYGAETPNTGLPRDYVIRQEATAEGALFSRNSEKQLQAFSFQPGGNIPQLLAQQLGLTQNALTLSGPSGIRTIFGGSGSLRHTISADLSSFTFSNQTELLGHWIVALVLDLDRDWTWDGLANPGLTFQSDTGEIGIISPPRVVSSSAASSPGKQPERSFSRVIFLDAISPEYSAQGFPKEIHRHYTVTAKYRNAAPQSFPLDIRLPITTPPAQTLRLVSTGIAESEYQHDPGYSSTTLRRRYLWVEFDRPIQDPEDAPFCRILAYGPDPLLAASLLPKPEIGQMIQETTPPPLPVDPEPVRRIFSGQSADESGLDAMVQLTPAESVGVGASGTFWMLPLPAEAADPRLFGFWTYEFRVGHTRFWSTAQGRYGRPLPVTGFQHPAPHLICCVDHTEDLVHATAPYAITVDKDGNRFFSFTAGDPQTRIWFMLYAQVLQADGASWRNILLTHALGSTEFENRRVDARPRATHGFLQTDIEARLVLLGLPRTSPLSVLAVELLPGPLNVNEGPGLPPRHPTDTERLEDPLGANLGMRRILRTSPLTAVPAIC